MGSKFTYLFRTDWFHQDEICEVFSVCGSLCIFGKQNQVGMIQAGLGFDLAENDLTRYVREIEIEDDQVWIGEGELNLRPRASCNALHLVTCLCESELESS